MSKLEDLLRCLKAHRYDSVLMIGPPGIDDITAEQLHALIRPLVDIHCGEKFLISAADKAVLDAAARMMFSNDGCDCIEIEDDGCLPEAELARRIRRCP